MRVSVIIPTYNHGRFIRETIESVQAQTVAPHEIIVIDDGSTDDTPTLLGAMQDERLRVIRTENRGKGAARNRGLDEATGDFIALLDSDDRWQPSFLERQLQVFDGEPDLGAVFCDFVRFDELGRFPGTQFTYFPELESVPSRRTHSGAGRVITADAFSTLVSFGQFPAYPPTYLVRADVARRIAFHDMALSQDLHYFLRIFLHVRTGYLAEPLAAVRRHGANSYTHQLSKLDADLFVLKSIANHEVLSLKQREALELRIARMWTALGYYYFHTRRPMKAARAYAHALGHSTTRGTSIKHLAALPLVPLLASPRKVEWASYEAARRTAVAAVAHSPTAPLS
jgi:glycosyltransferase involved in cell wall biosynthesis